MNKAQSGISQQQQQQDPKEKKNFCMVYYYVPEDQDDPNCPNAFGINISIENLRYIDIEKAFPLEGKYYFRFKYKYNDEVVWYDLKNKTSKLPIFNKRIFVKATRISWQSDIHVSSSQMIDHSNSVNSKAINQDKQVEPKNISKEVNEHKSKVEYNIANIHDQNFSSPQKQFSDPSLPKQQNTQQISPSIKQQKPMPTFDSSLIQHNEENHFHDNDLIGIQSQTKYSNGNANEQKNANKGLQNSNTNLIDF